MAISDLSSALPFIQSSGYLIVFILMVIEGPLITAAAAFAASLGIFDIWIIVLLSLMGNLFPDIFLYCIGRFTRGKRVESIVERLGLTKSRIKKLEKGFERHAGKTITFAKLIPPFPVPGLILAGFMRVPFKRFFLIDVVFNIVSTTVFIVIGFYLGLIATGVFRYFKIGEYALLLIIPSVLLVYWAFKELSKRLNRVNP